MKNYEITKENTPKKIRDAVKAEWVEKILNFVKNECPPEEGYEERAGMGRIGSSSQSNEIVLIDGTATEDGCNNDVCLAISITAKNWNEQVRKDGKVIPAFDYQTVREEYDLWVKKNEEKKAKSEAAKAEKTKKDKAKAERKTEVEEAKKRADEKSKAKTAEQIGK